MTITPEITPDASATSTGPANTGGRTALGQILSDMDATLAAVRRNDWVTAGLDGAATALDAVGGDPLSLLAEAGFGFLTGLVSFLTAPLETLSGDPGAVASGSQGLRDSGRTVSTLAGSYADAAGEETGGWSGSGASGYRQTASELADGLRTIAKSSSGVSGAIEGAGEVVARARQIITQLIGEAAVRINAIMSEALAAAPATGGASIAAAIPQAVGVAADYGQRIAGTMAALLSSAQNLASLVQVLVRALEAADQVVTRIGEQAGRGVPGDIRSEAPTADPTTADPGADPGGGDTGGQGSLGSAHSRPVELSMRAARSTRTVSGRTE